MSSPLNSALKKLKHYNGEFYCGNLTPSDVLVLAKCVGFYFDHKDIAAAKMGKKLGQSNPRWYYVRVHKDNVKAFDLPAKKSVDS